MPADTAKVNLLTPELLNRLGRLEVLAPQAVSGILQTGIHRSRTLGVGQEFEQYRRYVKGDDLRQADWHLFARSDQLHCRVQAPDTAARLAIVLDASASMGSRGRTQCSKLRAAAIVAACLAFLAERQGDALALFVYGEGVMPASGKNLAFAELCKRLENLAAQGKANASLAHARAREFISNKGMVVWLSDFLGEEKTLETVLRAYQLAGRACYVCQILDDDELQLPIQGPRCFQDPEDTACELLTDPEPVRKDYLARLGEFLESVRLACLRQGVPFACVTPTTDLAPVLAKLLGK